MDLSVYEGRVMEHSYNAGYIVLSYIISFAGCWTALELLHRRTHSAGMYNWFLLIGAANAMGAVAIWCMHYIGNRAIQMLNGEPGLQIEYSARYTVGSFFLPICVVGLAFYYFNQSEMVSIFGTVIGGLIIGLAVCGMYYTGQVGILNYSITYSWKHILGSAIIAVVANTAALGIFFYFKMTWTASLLRKIGCAALLAMSVSGMHWLAIIGTFYQYKTQLGPPDGLSRKGVVIVVLCLAIGCCLSLLLLAAYGERAKQRYADRARQVVLACATFDREGKILVTPEGLLPGCKITNSFIEHSFDDVFDVGHQTFCWIFRVSHCWQDVVELIPGIRAHLRAATVVKVSRRESKSTFSGMKSLSTGDSSEGYSMLFKELFCVAAQDLATLLQLPLENIGVLYEGIMNTGTIQRSSRRNLFFKRKNRYPVDIDAAEKGNANVIIGRGQLLFVVRRVNRADATQIQAAGYRFALVENVIDTLACSMEVTKEELSPYLENLKRHSEKERILEPGVHLACFALRPVFHRGFDIAVRQDAKNLLPTLQLPMNRLEAWHLDFLKGMDNWSVTMCCERLGDQSLFLPARELRFAHQFLEAMTEMGKQIENSFFREARLIASPVEAPCRSASKIHSLEYASIIAFRVIVDAHEHETINRTFIFSASRFFLCQQHVYRNSPDHTAFARTIHRELATLAHNMDQRTRYSVISSPQKSPRRYPSVRLSSIRSEPRSLSTNRSYSMPIRPSLSISPTRANSRTKKTSLKASPAAVSGGSHISSEARTDVSGSNRETNSPDIELASLGIHSEAGVALMESETFADQLMAQTIAERGQLRFEGRN